MRQNTGRRRGKAVARQRRGPHHIIIARGETIRSYVVRTRTLILSGALAFALVGGAAAAGLQAILRPVDDSSATLVSEVRQGYELRIADLSRQIDGLVSRQLADRATIEQQMADLAARQQTLTERQQLLTGLAYDAIRVGVDALPVGAPLPLANPLRGTNPVVDGTAVGGPTDPTVTGAVSPGDAGFDPRDRIAALDAAADVLERGQLAALETLALAVENRSDQLGNALAALGYAPNIGGPLVPVEPSHADFARVAGDLDALADLQAFAQTLPLGGPLSVMNVTSGYGTRRDPFLGQMAMHTGVDLAAASGTPVRATGPGEVIIAGANGGYGNMVEIDHGNGVTTKYGHLSTIAVEVGDVVAAGAMIGRSGSTGRSTGPHLHYEITRDGRTIDPMAHIRTGPQIVAMLRP